MLNKKILRYSSKGFYIKKPSHSLARASLCCRGLTEDVGPYNRIEKNEKYYHTLIDAVMTISAKEAIIPIIPMVFLGIGFNFSVN